jgi:hypothetical protein
MAITLGAPGVLIAWAVGLYLFVRGFYRPGPR